MYAVQALGKISLDTRKDFRDVDMISVSAHKIHGPKGVGALYVSPEALKRRDYVPLLLGGGQESGFRSGTENVIGIAALGAAEVSSP